VNNQRVQHCCQTAATAQGGLLAVALCSREQRTSKSTQNKNGGRLQFFTKVENFSEHFAKQNNNLPQQLQGLQFDVK
jgi:hypothetical protein